MVTRTNETLSPDEAIVDNARAYGGSVHGCTKTGAAVMVSGVVNADPRHGGKTRFVDLFMTREIAAQLRDDLNAVLARPEGE